MAYAMGQNLFYAQSGIAFTDIEGCGISGGVCTAGGEFVGDLTGWVVGIGIAHALTDQLSLTADLSYSDYGTEQFTTPVPIGGVTDVHLTTTSLGIGLQYRF